MAGLLVAVDGLVAMDKSDALVPDYARGVMAKKVPAV